ncbi:hypothetical protein [Streptomyces johnsoniae]|uniref:Uncharacterized protein n=1 Tax=Streptomyces johnsoniae TaxID=3075532 RepID=A0ABU2SD04_9ACTN|nr:hypothetical protein [Streptomyces sp. DSM 41886]MDT0445955.1 hypothetical protein [Streptomyces sp. DSM 41886]
MGLFGKKKSTNEQSTPAASKKAPYIVSEELDLSRHPAVWHIVWSDGRKETTRKHP